MEQQPINLAAVVDQLFAGAITTFTTSTAKEVQFKRANITQLGQITKFINLLIERSDPEKVKEFLTIVADEQAELMKQGKSVDDINLNTSAILEKGLNKHSLLLHIFSMMADAIPEFVTIFTNMREADYIELALDEQLVVAAGILVVNYGFFTQSLPPIIKSVVRGLAMLKSGKGKQDPAQK